MRKRSRQPSGDEPVQFATPTAATGKTGGGVYMPGRPGQGGLGSRVPVPMSDTARASNHTVSNTVTSETVSVSGNSPANTETQKVIAAGKIPQHTVVTDEQHSKLANMSEEDRAKYFMCVRQQIRAKQARAGGISIDIGACENMELDKIKVSHTPLTQEELDARADALAGQALQNAQQTQQPTSETEVWISKEKAAQKQKAAAAAAFAVNKLKEANQACKNYTYGDICSECCTSYGSQSGNVDKGYCVCK